MALPAPVEDEEREARRGVWVSQWWPPPLEAAALVPVEEEDWDKGLALEVTVVVVEGLVPDEADCDLLATESRERRRRRRTAWRTPRAALARALRSDIASKRSTAHWKC